MTMNLHEQRKEIKRLEKLLDDENGNDANSHCSDSSGSVWYAAYAFENCQSPQAIFRNIQKANDFNESMWRGTGYIRPVDVKLSTQNIEDSRT